jgi:hypothetical protein
VERSFIIAVNRHPGDDLGIALDFPSDLPEPRVIASDWLSNPAGCHWREVAPSFLTFAAQLGLLDAAE